MTNERVTICVKAKILNAVLQNLVAGNASKWWELAVFYVHYVTLHKLLQHVHSLVGICLSY